MDNARRGPKVGVWIAIGAVALVAIALGMALTARPSTDAAPEASATPTTGDGCGDVEAQSIALDEQIVGAQPRTCFVLEDSRQVTVGAAALEPTDSVLLTVLTASGDELGTAISEPDWDPEVSLELDPGVYVVEVAGDAGDVPPFLLYTATFPVQSEQPAPQASVPDVATCGQGTAIVADGSPVVIGERDADSARHHACLVLDAPAFVKVGLASEDPSSQDAPDLQLALYRAGEEPSLVRTVDDAIGLDPEMSLELAAGTYILEGTAWFDGPTGSFEFYVDQDGDLFRRGEVTSLHADASPALCDDAPVLLPGDAITVEGERTYVCVTVPQDQRLRVEAATLTEQDLVLEVIGFEDSGSPYRLAWADEDPTSDTLANFDPVIDQTFPAGTWLVAVTTYFTGEAADYDIAALPAAA